MCRCTPEIRTPFCGKPGCEIPPQKPVEDRWRRGMASILGELEKLYDRDEIGAVSICIALRDGNIRHLQSYGSGFRILLIAAAAVGLKEATDAPQRDADAENWHTPDTR